MSSNASKSTIALITGGNQGLGRAVATRLAKEHNYTVIIGSRNVSAGEAVAKELEAAGFAATAIQLDLASDASINAAVSTIEERYGRLDVLINNAGVLLDTGNAYKDVAPMPTRELFEKTFGPNVIGTACLTDTLLPLLRKALSPGPRVVFVSSRFGSFANATDRSAPFWAGEFKAYDASKAALNMLSINYSRILEDVGGVVNAVCPGLVSTSLIAYSPDGITPEAGAQRIVELATVVENAPHATFSDVNGPISW